MNKDQLKKMNSDNCKKVLKNVPDKLPQIMLHKGKPNNLVLPEDIPAAPEEVKVAYAKLIEAQRLFNRLKSKIEGIRRSVNEQINKLQTDKNYLELQNQVDRAVSILAYVMERNGITVAQFGNEMIALEKKTEKTEVQSKRERIEELQNEVSQLNQQILHINNSQKPITKDRKE
jgi:hypothetical protein